MRAVVPKNVGIYRKKINNIEFFGAQRLRKDPHQYMLSYIDCVLSYFRSESDAALTPMLKLHERW